MKLASARAILLVENQATVLISFAVHNLPTPSALNLVRTNFHERKQRRTQIHIRVEVEFHDQTCCGRRISARVFAISWPIQRSGLLKSPSLSRPTALASKSHMSGS